MRELVPSAAWSGEMHMVATLTDLVGDLFAEGYEHTERPGTAKPFETARPIESEDYASLLKRFRGGDAVG